MSEPIQLLYAEDNLGDVALMREAIAELGLALCLHQVGDGAAALAFLERRAPYVDAPAVVAMLLDLNLPRKSGLEVLQELAAGPRERVPPIVVLTTSAREQDLREAAGQLPFEFITKPIDFDEFLTVVTRIDAFARQFVKDEATPLSVSQ